MKNNKKIYFGGVLKSINLVKGPNKFELMESVFGGKKVSIEINETNEPFPANKFSAHFYSAEPSNVTNHYLHYQHVRNNNEEVPWRVKVAIMPNGMMLETFDNMVHYEGVYDANKGTGTLELMQKLEPELAN